MAAALPHTHFVAHTYHMDIKPGNFILDQNLDLVLIDWEQSDAPVTTAAPEIDGTWDAEEVREQAAHAKFFLKLSDTQNTKDRNGGTCPKMHLTIMVGMCGIHF